MDGTPRRPFHAVFLMTVQRGPFECVSLASGLVSIGATDYRTPVFGVAEAISIFVGLVLLFECLVIILKGWRLE